MRGRLGLNLIPTPVSRSLRQEAFLNTTVRSPIAALFVACLLCASCATTTTGGPSEEEGETLAVEDEVAVEQVADVAAPEIETQTPPPVESDSPDEGVVPVVVAEPERAPEAVPAPADELAEVVVQARARHEVIHDLVAEAQVLLRDVKLQYAFTGKGKREVLRGRPVAFALWSETKEEWTIAHVEIPRPPVKWKPGGRPMPFTVRTPGIQARHVKGTGAERLMFAFTKDGEPLKVFGRKFPVFDSNLLKKKRWRAVAETARPIVYLPFTEDTLDPTFVDGGKEYLLATARKAIEDLRAAQVPSKAYPGQLLADVVPPEVITTLAVIEQTDDRDYRENKASAFNEVLSHYGLKKGEAYRYSVSRASAIGPMQFTNRRRNGTYSMVVRRCPGARIDPDFERGATDLLNAMKAAICLFDIELNQMRPEIRDAYHGNMKVLGIFPVAAYNGGPRNVTKLYKVVNRMGVKLEDLRSPEEESEGAQAACPCLWREMDGDVVAVSIPRYNNENRWYIEKYQSILGALE
jgi:hypothetical protein